MRSSFGDILAIMVGLSILVNAVAVAETFMVDIKRKPTDKEWVPNETQVVKNLEGYQPTPDPEYSPYGGMLGTRFAATGFFYVRKNNGRWWLVDPDGHLTIHKALNQVIPGTGENYANALKAKYGTHEAWAEATAAHLAELGFNGTSAWSKDALLRKTRHPRVYCPIWHFLQSYARQHGPSKGVDMMMLVFDPEFEAFVDERASQLAATKDDPYLLGHFSDNEIRWNNKDMLKSCLRLAKTEPAYRAAYTWLKERRGEDDVDTSRIAPEERDAFYAFHAERYFRIVSSAMRKYDPNHLYLGCRMKKNDADNEILMQAAGKYVDIFSYNWYRQWAPDPKKMNDYSECSGRPFMATEFYAKGSDVPGLANTDGIGWVVRTQQDRGYFYQSFTLGLLANRNCVGWHWFRYGDNDPEDPHSDPSNNNSNKGIVNIRYEPYVPLTSQMKELNSQAYRLIEFFDSASYADAAGDESRKGE